MSCTILSEAREFLALSVFSDARSSFALPSYVIRTPVSRRASSGVLTTVAPEPRTPLRAWDMSSIERTTFGSDIRVGLEGAYGVDWDEFRESQCIVFDIDGRRPRCSDVEEFEETVMGVWEKGRVA